MKKILFLLLLLVSSPVSAQAPTLAQLDSMRVEMVRGRAFVRSADTQYSKLIAQLDSMRARMVVVAPPPAPAPPPPAPAPPPPPTTTGGFFSDGFDTYALNSQIQNQGANGFTWGLPHEGVFVSNTFARSGTQSLKFEFGHLTDPHWWAEQNFNFGRDLKEMWMEYYIYFPSDFLMPEGTAQNNKFLALWADSYGSEPLAIYQFWTTGDRNVARLDVARTAGNRDGDSDLVRYPRADEGNGPIRGGNLLSSAADRGRWIRIRAHVRVADLDQSHGQLRMWKDDALLVDLQNEPFFDEGRTNNFLRQGYLLGYDNARFATPVAIYIDDFRVFDSSPGW